MYISVSPILPLPRGTGRHQPAAKATEGDKIHLSSTSLRKKIKILSNLVLTTTAHVARIFLHHQVFIYTYIYVYIYRYYITYIERFGTFLRSVFECRAVEGFAAYITRLSLKLLCARQLWRMWDTHRLCRYCHHQGAASHPLDSHHPMAGHRQQLLGGYRSARQLIFSPVEPASIEGY
jgi:hypothetical protein